MKMLLLSIFILPFLLPGHSFIYVAPVVVPVQEIQEKSAILEKIAFCESSNNPLAKNSKSSARGLYQITKGTEEFAEKHLGVDYDVFNPNDAQIVAEWLYERYGTKPWKQSANCWKNI